MKNQNQWKSQESCGFCGSGSFTERLQTLLDKLVLSLIGSGPGLDWVWVLFVQGLRLVCSGLDLFPLFPSQRHPDEADCDTLGATSHRRVVGAVTDASQRAARLRFTVTELHWNSFRTASFTTTNSFCSSSRCFPQNETRSVGADSVVRKLDLFWVCGFQTALWISTHLSQVGLLQFFPDNTSFSFHSQSACTEHNKYQLKWLFHFQTFCSGSISVTSGRYISTLLLSQDFFWMNRTLWQWRWN